MITAESAENYVTPLQWYMQ